jgi:hypothetical protein
MKTLTLTLAIIFTLGLIGCGSDNNGNDLVTTSFENLTLEAESFWNGSDGAGQFECNDIVFPNNYNSEYSSWDGFAYSNQTDTTTAGFENQYSAITGGGANGTTTYVVATPPVSGPLALSLADASMPTIIVSLMITNTTYAYLSMKNGDDFAKKFGGENGEDEDWFLLTITGKDASGTTGTVEFYLADYRGTADQIVDSWTEVDLSSLGPVTGLEFALTSSDVGEWGMNTPAYFAIDDIVVDGE